MSAHRIFGIACLVCALAAILGSASSASAATLATCRKGTEPPLRYKDADCAEEVLPLSGQYFPAIITPGSSTSVLWTPIKGILVKGVIAGVSFEASCNSGSGTGSVIDEEVGGEGVSAGSEIKLVFSECVVLKPVGQNCKVKGSSFEIPSAKSITFLKEGNVRVKVSPTSGTTLSEVALEGCKTAGLNTSYKLTGSDVLVPEGALERSTEQSSGEGELKLAGQAVSLELLGTLQMAPFEGIAQPALLYVNVS